MPIDTHVNHIFRECLEVDYVPKVDTEITSQGFEYFQNKLFKYTANNTRIYFDYL